MIYKIPHWNICTLCIRVCVSNVLNWYLDGWEGENTDRINGTLFSKRYVMSLISDMFPTEPWRQFVNQLEQESSKGLNMIYFCPTQISKENKAPYGILMRNLLKAMCFGMKTRIVWCDFDHFQFTLKLLECKWMSRLLQIQIFHSIKSTTT